MKAFLAIISYASGMFKLTDDFETGDILSAFWNILTLLKILKTLSWSNGLLAIRWENQGVESLSAVTPFVGCSWDLGSPLARLGSSGWRRWNRWRAFPQGGCLGSVWAPSPLSVTKKASPRNSRWPSSSRHTTESVIKAKSASLTLFRPSSLSPPNLVFCGHLVLF